MNRSLTARIVSLMVLVTALSLVVFVVVLNHLTVRTLEELGTARDRIAAQRLLPWLERYYAEQGTFHGAASVLERAELPALPGMPGSMGMGPVQPEMRRQRRAAIEPDIGPVALFDPAGRLITGAQTAPGIREPDDQRGLPVRHDGVVIARLYVGTMLQDGLGPFEEKYLASLRFAASVTLVIVAAAATFAGFFITRTVVRPVTAAARATQAIADGDYDVRLDTSRRDEIGVLARSVARMAKDIEAQERLRRRFLADAAHELRTPIALLSSRLEMVESGIYALDEEQLALMNRNLSRMARLVEDLQTLARYDAPPGKTDGEDDAAFDPAALVDSLVASFAGSADDVRIVGRREGLPDAVPGDRGRIEQVVTNLISNALRYAPPSTDVVVSAVVAEPWLELSVEDRGTGIPEEFREAVFERFFRLDESRSRSSGGNGLGLSISHEIVRHHGGTLHAEEAPGGGARFVCRLPLHREETTRR